MFEINRQSGFTLIEVLLMVTIFTILLASSFSLSNTQLFEDDLQAKVLEVSDLIERARNNSATGYLADVWSIKVLDSDSLCDNSGDCILLFKGNDFAGRDTDYDRFVQFDQSITGVYFGASQENEFYFDYKSGWLATSTASYLKQQNIVLNNNAGDQESIMIFPTGVIATFVCGQNQIFDSSGNAYNTIKIGTQCWTAENLNVGSMLSSVNTDPTDNDIVEKWCYGDTSANCDLYGGLYSWNEAMDYGTSEGSQGICPSGWHIPKRTDDLNYIENVYAATNLKIGGNSGFDLMIGGLRVDNGSPYYDYILGETGALGGVWSSTYSSSNAYFHSIADASDVSSESLTSKDWGVSVRCVEDY